MQKCSALVLCVLLALSGADAVDKAHPVSKVITLMKDMVAQLDKEAAEDEETYETMGCWCETNDKEKTKAIADAEARISLLGTAIEELTGKSAKLNEEIASLDAEVAKNSAALDTAAALRTKQLAEFNAEEKDALGSITSLKSAVTTLEKHNGAAFLQVSDEDQLDVLAIVRSQLRRHGDQLVPSQRRALQSFVQQPDDYFGAQQVSLQQQSPASYSSQSGQIFGILKQMKETFETNLASSQTEEASNQKAFEDLKAAKTDEIAAGTTQSEAKTQELADTDEKNALSKEDKENTEETLAADTKFLADLKDKCANFDAEYAARTKTRQLETEAVSKAMEFLTSDEAHELFTRTLGMFVQKSSQSGRQAAVSRILRKAAAKSRDPRLSALAVRMRLDSFTKVKATLQDMSDRLMKEKEEDIKHKDVCNDNFNKNDAETQANERKKAKLIAKIEDLQMSEDQLAKAIEQLKSEIAELNLQMKRAGEDRELENKDYQLVVADQRATEKLLEGSLAILKGFYDKMALVQSGAAGGKQPANFKAYEKSASSGGLLSMMNGIINDTKQLEAEAITAEEDAQTAYEIFTKDSNEAVTEKTKDMINKIEVKGKTEAEKAEKEIQRDETLTTLEELKGALHDIHIDCDFLLKNYDIRTEARDEEIEALKQAIAMFAGASFSTFLQNLQ